MSDKKNLTQTIEDIDMFSVFARLMRTSGLNDILGGGGPLTIFAPTNDAFRMIPDKVMNGWLSETSQTMLRTVLSYHIVTGRMMAANLGLSSRSATSISGQKLEFSDDKGLRVNDSGVQARNIEATDGIIHALDKVLTPPSSATDHTTVSTQPENVLAAWPGEKPFLEGDISPRVEPIVEPPGHGGESGTPDAQRQPVPPDPRQPERRIAPSPERTWKLS